MDLWIFGYGSLMWSPGFDYDQKVAGYVKDYRRAFYQGNTDHRGTLGSPGRTVTLVPYKGATCWGIAYGVSGHDKKNLVLSYLELREKEYDVRACLDLYTRFQPSMQLQFAAKAEFKTKISRDVSQMKKSVNNQNQIIILTDVATGGRQDSDIDNLVKEVQKFLGSVNACFSPEKATSDIVGISCQPVAAS